MNTKIFLAIMAMILLTVSSATAGYKHKAVIYQDPENRYYYLVDPELRVALTPGYGLITTDPQGRFIGHSAVGCPEVLDSYLSNPVHRVYYQYLYEMGGFRIGELGTCKYVLEPMTGEALSEGYQKIYLEKGKLIGENGSAKEVIKLRRDRP
ncbi:MAG: hypothetical protein NT093_00785 [Candidatus Moranbacteria bacterium]|nr:hypothetical protein [Candidatus Moranbacteria bacterium]